MSMTVFADPDAWQRLTKMYEADAATLRCTNRVTPKLHDSATGDGLAAIVAAARALDPDVRVRVLPPISSRGA